MERGRFQWPASKDKAVTISVRELRWCSMAFRLASARPICPSGRIAWYDVRQIVTTPSRNRTGNPRK
ncbi:hypothetical protein [Paenibacillus naphthalenovorans]|uniref:hypothetical protein n=1 Tax=Paenibacillus naphthalenovorans TaxID=162209 RepID=UPI003D2AB5BC